MDKVKLAERVMDLCQQSDWQGRRSTGLIKLILSSLWNHLPYWDRVKFMACIDEDLVFSLPDKTPKKMQDEADLARALRDWSSVLEHLSGDELAFANDVDIRRRWKRWQPTEKQAAWIMRIWKERHVSDMAVVE